MKLDFFQALTIINSVLIAILPIAFFRRQKIQEIKYKEIMELNVKVHDITKRADRNLTKQYRISTSDYERLDYLISRFKKHSKQLSKEIQEYKEMWDSTTEKGKDMELDKVKKNLIDKSEKIRELADKLLK